MGYWEDVYNYLSNTTKKNKKKDDAIELKASDLPAEYRQVLDEASQKQSVKDWTSSVTSTVGTLSPKTQVKMGTQKVSPTSFLTDTPAGYRHFDTTKDVAPKKPKEESLDVSPLDFLSKGTLEDGWQWGDILKGIGGTAQDLGANIVYGAGKAVEGIADAGMYLYNAGAKAGNFLSKNTVGHLYDKMGIDTEKLYSDADKGAESVKGAAQIDTMDYLMGDTLEDLDENSFVGETFDAVGQGVGNVAFNLATGAVGKGIGLAGEGLAWFNTATMFTSGFGNGTSEAYADGATDAEAYGYGVIAGTVEALSERLFSGMGKLADDLGHTAFFTIDDVVAKKLTSKISNQTIRNIGQWLIKAGFEGTEEVGSGLGQAIGKRITYMSDEELSQIIKDENLFEQFVVGFFTSGLTQGGDVVKATKAGTDLVTESAAPITENEESVIQKMVGKIIEGKGTVSKREENQIREQVIDQMNKGQISIEDIVETLGGDTLKAYKDNLASEENTINELRELYQGEELDQQIKDLLSNSKSGEMRSNLVEEVYNLVKDTRLAESFNEVERRYATYQADLSKYDEKQRATIQKAIESGVLNNTRRTHEFVDWIAKISADKGVLFDFTNNKKLRESGFAIDGKIVNGFKTKDGITLNTQSSKMLESTVGHEISHVLEESPELYKVFAEAAEKYARGKKASDSKFANEYIERLYNARQLYKNVSEDYQGIEGHENIKKEVIADLVGDYLFTDNDFIMNLSANHRNLFQKIYDEIKYLYKVVTAGSKEARALEKVKKAFEDAYRAGSNAQKNTATDSGVKFSIAKTSQIAYGTQLHQLEQGKMNSSDSLYIGTPSTQVQSVGLSSNPFAMNQSDYRKSRRESAKNSHYSSHAVPYEFFKNLPQQMADAPMLVDEGNKATVITSYGMKDTRGNDSYVIGGVWRDQQLKGDRVNLVKSAYPWDDFTRRITQAAENEKLVVTNKNKAEQMLTAIGIQPAEVSRILNLAKSSLTQQGEIVNRQFSLSTDSTGKQLSAEQQEHFKDSKIRDKDGNLLVLYHGTTADFTVFDVSRSGENYGGWSQYGKGLYLTPTKKMAQYYADEANTGRETKLMTTYANISNPFNVNDPVAFDIYDLVSKYNLTEFDASMMKKYGDRLIEFMVDHNEDVRSYLMDKGYDGIWDALPSSGVNQVVAFNPEQIKNVDNAKPTSNPDIRYSISDSNGNKLSAEQQEYFADSKVRDSNGNLLTVYHTTDSDFTVFDNAKKGANTETYNTYMGFFFSGSDDYMKNFPEFKDGKTTAYYLDMKKPIDMTNMSKQAFLDIVEVTGGDVQEAAEIYDAELKAEQQRANFRGDNDTSLYLSGLLREMVGDYDDMEFHEALKPNFDKLKAKGYDGVINFMDEMAGEKEYIVFDSNQAKLTTNTNPSGNPDVRYSLSAETDKTYLDAVSRGDTETAQKMVNKAAKDAGFSVNGYHGTTNLFYVYDTSKSNVENDWGRGIYATTSEEDAQVNYASDDGADLTNRIERLAEMMENWEEYEDLDYDQRVEVARNQLSQGENRLLNVAFRMENPVVVEQGNGGTFFTYESEYDEDLDEYSEPSGTLIDVVEQMQDIIYEDYEWASYDADKLAQLYEEALDWGGLSAVRLQSSVDDILIDVTDEDGNMAGREILRSALERMGFDGIVDKTVPYKFGELSGKRYGGMRGVAEGTTHYIAFNSSQVKLTDPVTYDDNGDVIPLSKRFNAENDDIRYSLSKESETPKTYGNFGTYGKDIALEELPIRQDVAASVAESPVTADNAEAVVNPLPDDMPMADEELDALVQQKESLEEQMLAMSEQGNFDDEFYQLNQQWVAVSERVKALEDEIAERDADYMDSFDDADAPPIAEQYNDSTVDVIPITKKLENDIAREVRAKLNLGNKQMADVRSIINEYSQSEFPSREQLFEELKDKFGTFTESYTDEDLVDAKKYLRTYGLQVGDYIKREIADYDSLRKQNRYKIRFSDAGTPVDLLYQELNGMYPHLFPESIDVPTDQFMRIVDVANMDKVTEYETALDDESIYDVADTIINAVSEYRGVQKEKAANKYGRESFNGLMQDADQYVPPINLDQVLRNRRNPVETYGTVDAPETIDAPARKGVPEGQQAMWEEPVPKVITRKDLHEGIVVNARAKFAKKGLDFDEVLKNAKNLSTFATVDNTPQRVMEKALGYKAGQILGDITVNKVAQNETEGIKWLNSITDRKKGLLAQLSKQYHIYPGSKESAAAQMYAEGFYVNGKNEIVQYGDAELAQDFRDRVTQGRIKGLARDPRIRQFYDDTLASINESRARNAYPEIPKLDNYFLHFRAMDDTFSQLGLPFNPNDIRAKDLPTDLNGVTADLKPGQPYFASAMHRTGKRTSFDLLGGLERYATSAKNQIYHIDDIQTLRALRNYIADTYGQANGLEGLDDLTEEEQQERIQQVYNSHLSTFAKFLNEEANVLAGKTALIDRGLEGIIGRRGITFLNTLNQQVGKNMVGFNISSSLTNFLPVAQTFAKTNKFDFLKAFAQTTASKVGSIFGKENSFAENSPVMIRRKGADSFYRTPWQKAGDAGYVFMSAVDDISTELIARTKYNELTRKGMDAQQAHIETDKWVSRLMGDRSLGQQPQLYNSKMLGLVTKFQLEVRNQLDSQFYDTIQEAKASTEDIQKGLARNVKVAAKVGSTFFQLAVAQHLFGKAFESVAGYNPAFDIIDVLIKTFGWDDDEEDEDTILDNVEEGFLALLEDLPYTSTFTGGRIPIESALPINQLITGKDSYGNEVSRWDTIKEAAPYYFLPGGYGQLKKTQKGLAMFDDELPISGSYTDSGNLRFPVEDTWQNRLQAGVFGQWASENARDYFDNERKPLQEKQIQEFIDVDIPIRDYWDYREGLSDYDKLADKADYIDSLDLPTSKKNILINNIADRKDPIDMMDYGKYGSFEEFDFAEKNQEKYSILQENGITYRQYKAFDDNTKEYFNWATKYPEKYTVSRAVTDDILYYGSIRDDLDKLDAKDASGKTVSGLKKERTIEYINNLPLDYGQKAILYRSLYDSKSDRANYNADILEYLNSRNDISYEDKVTILEELDFKVYADGTVKWD